MSLLKQTAVSFHWEFMFTRSMFQTVDMIEQHKLLNRVSSLLDDGTLKTTATTDGGAMTAANMRKAHALQESATAIGKTTLTVG